MHDKYKKTHRSPRADDRARRQIAEEAARRLVAARPEGSDDPDWLGALGESDLYTAKRKAAAVLGRSVRPGDLPSDSEVRLRAAELIRSGVQVEAGDADETEEGEVGEVARMADHLDRFTLYALRLAPLEAIKGDPRTHPEGDALYHSLQVFELAREARPYDEEFLLAALLHDVGKAIDRADHVASAVEAIRGSVTDRTLWLVEHHHDLDDSPRARRPADADPAWLDDLRLLVDCDRAGRVAGRPVEGVEAALAYLRALDREEADPDA